MSDWCGTACALHPHPAAHGMPAHCEVGDAHPTACPCLPMPALHNCSASFPLALPFLRMIWWGKKTKRGRGGSCVPPERSAHKCVHHTHWMQSGDSAHTHTHTCSWRASLLPHHSTKKGCGDRHGESVWWCGPWSGRHGVVAMVSCAAGQHGFHLCQAKRRESVCERGS